ncbi:cytochrome b-c1 complex subunit 7 [[Candida] railenensis]|uniref:Cytochrome b-c1 complex subunit 7 n=1 Tax=[Candida] railenensis TaxID=45579 RepID=A0A9P0QRM2_9ASCO|nr:cytochrome b-c1 complex subunit 7 [[Candida] railenensis]
MASITSIVKTADFILSRPTLSKIITPIAKTFVSYAGYREMGLKFNDLLLEETPIMQKAISRLPADESYARNYRFITAHQLSLSHQLLPESKAVKPEEDTNYLVPYILEAEKEAFEKAELDSIVITK